MSASTAPAYCYVDPFGTGSSEHDMLDLLTCLKCTKFIAAQLLELAALTMYVAVYHTIDAIEHPLGVLERMHRPELMPL